MRFQIIVCVGALAVAAAYAQPLPHLEKRGQATQLMVDGKPFLMLAGELNNTISSDPESMRAVWPALARRGHLNTVLTGVAWNWTEPAEGKYDFHFVDEAIRGAQQADVRLVLLWFGSWKNALSSFAPVWVKADQERFPRAQVRKGKTLEILSTLSENNRKADERAFAALMRHVRETDSTRRVIMVQVENEVGLLGDSRDRSAAANQAFAGAVPGALLDRLKARGQALKPGTWAEVFGGGQTADEIFMAWNYARYMNAVAEAGKREYDIPMYVNAWLVQPRDMNPGDYPSGGPQAHMHEIWRAAAPSIDLLCPDIYVPEFTEVTAEYARVGGPLFVPESFDGATGAANAFYAIGAHAGLGYSPFAIDRLAEGSGFETSPMTAAYEVLGQLAPAILEHQSKGTIAAVSLDKKRPEQRIQLGGYTLTTGLIHDFFGFSEDKPDVPAYGIFMATGPDEFLMAGDNLQISFTPTTPGPPIASVALQEAGRFENGKWVVTRLLGGDDSVLRYDFAKVAEEGISGSGVRLHLPVIQKVKLYRYR